MLKLIRAYCAAIAVLCTATTSFCAADTADIATEIVQAMPGADPSRGDLRPDADITRAEIIMRVHFAHLQHIFHFGFLNQFQSKHSSGSYAHSSRIAAENRMLGFDIDMHPTSLHPKYGTLFVETKTGLSFSPSTTHYGNVFFRFKDSLVRRTTYSPYDSLGSPIVFPLSDFASLSARLRSSGISSYLEAQIWGDVTLSDVAEIWLPGDKVHDPAMLAVCKEYGIKVFEYSGSSDWDIARTRTLVHNFAPTGKVFQHPTVSEYVSLLTKLRDTQWISAVFDGLGRLGSPEAIDALKKCIGSAVCDRSREAVNQAIQAVERGKNSLFRLFNQARHDGLKKAIVRFLEAKRWDVPEEMRAFAGFAPKPAPIIKLVDERAAAPTPPVRHEATPPAHSPRIADTPPPSRTSSGEVTRSIRDLLHQIRESEDSSEINAYIAELNELLSDRANYPRIIEKLGDHSRFAHIVSKYADQLPRSFIKVFYDHLKTMATRESALRRAYESCAAVFGEAA